MNIVSYICAVSIFNTPYLSFLKYLCYLSQLNRMHFVPFIYLFFCTNFTNKLAFPFFVAMAALTEAMCWKVVAKDFYSSAKVGLVIYQKPISSSCYENRKQNNPPLCDPNTRPNSSWYTNPRSKSTKF